MSVCVYLCSPFPTPHSAIHVTYKLRSFCCRYYGRYFGAIFGAVLGDVVATLGRFWAPFWVHVRSMLAPCCLHVGSLLSRIWGIWARGAPGRQSQRKKLSFMLAGLRFAKTRLAKNMVRAHGCARRQSENAFFSEKSYYDCQKTWSAHIDVQNP